MAGHDLYDTGKNILVCSIDTLRTRQLTPETDLIVIDEAHMCACASYKELAAAYPDKFFLGVTATPFPRNSIEHIAEHVVYPITHEELIKEGHLVRGRYKIGKKVDLRGVKVSRSTGDFDEHSLGEFMEKRELVASAPESWLQYAENRPTICFAVTVSHSRKLQISYEDAGISAAHLDAKTPDDERAAIIERHRKGEIKVLCNVGILHVGVDMPWVSCIQVCRPTLSPVWHVQALGRATRPFPGKEDFLVLDHANNVGMHGEIEMERKPVLEGTKRQSSFVGVPMTKMCPECKATVHAAFKKCPYCEFDFYESEPKPPPKHVAGEMVDYKKQAGNNLFEMIKKRNQLLRIAQLRGIKRGWVWHQLCDKYGKQEANRLLPWTGSQDINQTDFT
jgi:superfamily II DNA or RNA helicase